MDFDLLSSENTTALVGRSAELGVLKMKTLSGFACTRYGMQMLCVFGFINVTSSVTHPHCLCPGMMKMSQISLLDSRTHMFYHLVDVSVIL